MKFRSSDHTVELKKKKKNHVIWGGGGVSLETV